jgi:hypothetical protein
MLLNEKFPYKGAEPKVQPMQNLVNLAAGRRTNNLTTPVLTSLGEISATLLCIKPT